MNVLGTDIFLAMDRSGKPQLLAVALAKSVARIGDGKRPVVRRGNANPFETVEGLQVRDEIVGRVGVLARIERVVELPDIFRLTPRARGGFEHRQRLRLTAFSRAVGLNHGRGLT